MSPAQFFASVLDLSIEQIRAAALPVYTFALYHDHESAAVSVCADTEENSNKTVASTNRYNMKYFMKAIASKDLKAAALWQANIGRSLALGDFSMVNVARTDLRDIMVDDTFYLAMVQSLMAVQDRVASLSPAPERLLLACSGPDDEVAYVWSLPSDA